MIRFPQSPADISARDAVYRRMAAGHAFVPYGSSCGRCGGAAKHHVEVNLSYAERVAYESYRRYSGDAVLMSVSEFKAWNSSAAAR